MNTTSNHKLLHLLASSKIPYRLLIHRPGTDTAGASAERGHDPAEAAKSVLLRAGYGRRRRSYVTAVVPGDRRVSFRKIMSQMACDDISFAALHVAETLTGCESGTIPPLSFAPDHQVIVDSSLATAGTIYFNTGRHDQSVGVAGNHWVLLTEPVVADIAWTPIISTDRSASNSGPEFD